MPQGSPDVEILGLHRERLGDPQIIPRIIHGKVEILQQHGNGKQHFLPRKRPSDARPHAIAKGLPAVRVLLLETLKVLVEHAFGAEEVGVFAKDSRVEVGDRQEWAEDLALCDGVLVVEEGVCEGFRGDSGDGGADTECFAKSLQDRLVRGWGVRSKTTHSRDVFQLKDLLNGDGFPSHNVIHFSLGLLITIRVLE